MKSRKHCSICGEAGHTKTTCLAEFLPRATAVGGVAVTPPTALERCPTCDREGCPTMEGRGYILKGPTFTDAECAMFDRVLAAMPQCNAIGVELWRARAIAAEAAAARWRKVAPLIERLADDVRRRELIARAEFDRRVSDTVTAMLAATESTP